MWPAGRVDTASNQRIKLTPKRSEASVKSMQGRQSRFDEAAQMATRNLHMILVGMYREGDDHDG